MPEITPRELGEEAKALYGEHKSAEDQVYVQTEAFEYDLKKARSTHESAVNQYAAVRANTTLDANERAEKNLGIGLTRLKISFSLGGRLYIKPKVLMLQMRL